MSYYLNKLYPQNGEATYRYSLSLIFIAEGYTASQKNQFFKDVSIAYDKLLAYDCLSNLKFRNNFFGVYSLFIPSSQTGIAPNKATAAGRSPFESYLDSSGLHLNYSKVETVLESSFFNDNNDGSEVSKRLIVNDQGVTKSLFPALPVFIFPNIATQIGEIENLISNQYYFLATTLDNYYEQIVARSLLKLIGLGDEFELPGTDKRQPVDDTTGKMVDYVCPNLLYTTNPSGITLNSSVFKWKIFFSESSSLSIGIHPHPAAIDTPDRTLPSIPLSYGGIALWEGGGGYRKNIYRSAYDCLLRRRVGDSTLPVKAKRVGLCPICSTYLKKATK